MSNFWGHFKTITTHKLRVMKYCFRAGLYKQGLLHDLSKYTPVEFLPGVKYYQGNRSPNEMERLEKGYSSAWLHHKGRNRHHLEYWIDYAPELGYKMGGMVLRPHRRLPHLPEGEIHRRLPLGLLRQKPGPLHHPPQDPGPAGKTPPHAPG